ncbi:MAG: hypothetical protein ACOVMM_07780 [Chitinophagaceae bacterium]
MKLKILFFLSFGLVCFILPLKAQKKCISGDCYNGHGVVLKQNGDSIISDFVNGKVTNQVLVASKNNHVYRLTSVSNTKWYLEKSGDSLRIGKGAVINQVFVVDSTHPIYFLSKKGDLLSQLNNRIIHFESDGFIRAYENRNNDESSRFVITSNSMDYLFQNYENNKAVNGFLFISSTNRFIHFKNVDNKYEFYNDKDKQIFDAKYKSLNSFSLGGFDEYYFDNFTKQRTISSLEQYITKLKNTLLKPLDDFNKVVEHAKKEYINFKLQPEPIQEFSKQITITLTYQEWINEMQKEVQYLCKTEFAKAYNDFLDEDKIFSFMPKDFEIFYNITRDGNNKIIGLGELSSNNKISFLVPAFKKAFSNITSEKTIYVTNAKYNHFDLKTMKEFGFKFKLER